MITYDSARAEVQSIVGRFENLKPTERKNLNEQATRLGYILPRNGGGAALPPHRAFVVCDGEGRGGVNHPTTKG